MRGLIVLCCLAALSGCWVTPSPVSKNVAVVNGVQVAQCRLVGKADLSVPDKLGSLQRVPDDMENDLQTLAKNQAVNAGGDTVAPLSVQDGGKQSWGYYACGPGAMAAAEATGTASPAPAAATGVKTLPYTPPR
ncbi:MAG TPA: DUF4156 domain-containing protein [Gammaproteobacteria bacterium]|nr:DUF4156 domain-containing protein [Gammaproteobacteria bacterium]